MSETWRQSEIYIVINDKSQGSILDAISYFATHLSLNLLVKEFFSIGEHLAKLQAKWFIV